MINRKEPPEKICRAGGREFRVYTEYDDLVEHDVPVYPDFEENPQYTDEGQPFATAVQDGCAHGDSGDPQDPDPGGCGGCIWFHREEPFAIIGVCLCDELKCDINSGGNEK